MTRRRARKPSPIPEEERPSPSVSPELGFQDEINKIINENINQNENMNINQNENSNDTDTISTTSSRAGSRVGSRKKRGPKIAVNKSDDVLIAFLEEKIVDALQTVYTTTCGIAGPQYATEMLQDAFNKIQELSAEDKPRMKKIFFEKIQHRLCFMVEALTSLDSRRRVFRFLADFFVNQWRKGIPDFLEFVIHFCEELSLCEDPTVRQNVCTITGFVLSAGRGQCDIGTARALSVEFRQRLYEILLSRQIDKSGAVRREVILSVADIQDDDIPNDFPEALERSPKDMILMGLRDSVADCRLTAAFALNVIVPEHADYLIELASCDPATNVRVVAIRQLATLPLTFFTEQQRMDLMRGVVFEDEPSIVDVLYNVLVSEWLKFIHRVQEKRNRRRVHCIEVEGSLTYIKEEVDDSDIMNLSQNLRDLRTDHGYGSAALGLLVMLDFCDDPEAEPLTRRVLFVVFDVIREKLQLEHSQLTHFISSLVNDNTHPEVLSTHNYRTLLDDSLSGTDQAQYAFFWRTLIEYCAERTDSEAERLECIYMLAPPLAEMCQMVQRLKTRYEPSSDIYCLDEGATQICDIQQIALMHLLGILRHLDHKDEIGMSEWRSLLLLILRDQFWSKEITDCAMNDLADFFFDDKPEPFLATLHDFIIEAITNAPSPYEVNGGSKSPDSRPKRPRRSLDLHQADERTRRFCMQITHSMLRTGVFAKFSPILQKLYEDIISPCLSTQNTQLHIWAMESAAILGALDQDIAAETLPSTSTAIESDEEALKISVIDVVADMIVIYGCRDVLSWCRSAAGDSDNGRSFINELIDIVMCKKTGPLLCVKACECLAKIVMAESLSTEDNYLIEALVALISRMFHAFTVKMPAVKNCLECFFGLYPAVSRKNQLLLIAAFHELMSHIRNASGDDFVLRINIADALNLIVNSTSRVLLRNASDRKEGSVQPLFMRELLTYANENPEDTCALLYWETAAALELNEFSLDQLKETQNFVAENMEMMIANAGLKSKVAGEIKGLLRHVENALATYSLRKAEELEGDDRLTELRDKFARTPGRGKRRTPKSSMSTPVRSSKLSVTKKKKTSTSAKKTTQQLLERQETPSPPSVAGSLVTPVARTRPLLSRSAKQAAVTKTRRWLFEKNDNSDDDDS